MSKQGKHNCQTKMEHGSSKKKTRVKWTIKEEIVAEVAVSGFCYTGKEINVKLHNFTNKYRMENRTGKDPLVADAAAVFQRYIYEWRNTVPAGNIVAGWDKQLGGQVYSIPLGDLTIRETVTIGGSGSAYIYGFVRKNYRPQMQVDECDDFVVRAIKHPLRFDGSSGGVVRVGIITKDGGERRVFYITESWKPTEAGN